MPDDLPSPPTDALTPDAAPPLKLKLVVVSGPDFGVELTLDRGTYRVGKDPDNELALTDLAVSRTHLLVEVLQSGARFRDNASTNGSFCDGMRFTSLEAKPGARVKLGRTVLRLMPAVESAGGLAPSARERFGELVGRSLAMREVFAVLEKVAPGGADVLVRGETGTGKEVCARAIHAASSRAAGPLVVCDLSAVAAALFESELFGHVRGAFTGALTARAGVFERAHRGTLFLDEVGDLPIDLQPRLLGALERRQVTRVGGNEPKAVDVRVIAATRNPLEEDLAAGRFRSDLFHRLAAVEVTLPPLRQRLDDVPLLADEILARLGKEKSALSDQTRALLRTHSWPGNVRELRNVVERAVSLGQEAALAPEAAAPGGKTPSGRPFKEAKDELVSAFERDYVADLLARCGGNVSLAAREAGIDRVYLHRLLKKHRLPGK
ncbi:MAG: sigma 54-interacting transcriptional regulator [Myxococcaceae bacterium]